jgi:hypothetical protein
MMAHQVEAQHPEVGGPGVREQQLVPALVELLAPLEPREERAHVHLGACRGRRDGHEEAAQPLEVVLVHLVIVADDSLEPGQPLAELGGSERVHHGHLPKRVDPVLRGDVKGAGRHGEVFWPGLGFANVISPLGTCVYTSTLRYTCMCVYCQNACMCAYRLHGAKCSVFQAPGQVP